MVTQFNLYLAPSIVAITFGAECDTRTSSEVLGLMVHELTHVKQYIEDCIYEDNIGGSRKRLDIETEAYLMQAMLMWLQTSYTDSGRSFDDGQE